MKNFDKKKPLITVITVVYNGEKYLDETIKSVAQQTYDNIEYIIVDGGSTDGTLDIIKKNNDHIDCWISEKDNGIYDAMNKGMGLANGEYIAYLNADDWYKLDAIENIVKTINLNKVDFIFGKVHIYKNDKVVKVFKPNLKNYKMKMPFGHPSLFVKRDILLKYRFNEAYPIIADYDLVIRLLEHKHLFKEIDEVLTCFRLVGISSVTNLKYDHYKLYKEHFGNIHALWFYSLQSIKDIVKLIMMKK